ncbi:SDR family oxidoreductase [Mycobacterium crocinum]|uniref:SDR family oxidoreductase n=1 Tax=Mycolicibacterium crocinum TaxID=388459 RepID=A0ABY3TLL6_9MYCO|nr:SDR family oxidoreductase [Mycolicibacterium crocinum]MCV7216812.1 SDR family oxidoreductase [Mycolicibacterium crocinum]ULN40083.1 SDR family oxidoreductase [Mycolicibacterium crocinum]
MADTRGKVIDGSIALVTGANRGLGKAFTQALLDRGATKVYAAARNPNSVQFEDPRVVPIALDITDSDAVRAAARTCADVSVLINNAGAMLQSPFLTAEDPNAARVEMETNYFGTLAMARAFAPVLAAQPNGSALVNMLSVVSFYTSPFNASYGASKAAEWALTNALRIELHSQGTHVVGVHAGFIDTDMAAVISTPKISPEEVADQTMDAIETGTPEVLADERTRATKNAVPTDQTSIYPEIQKAWDAGDNPWLG